jgi:tRNA(His) 5'-end guanylyltransferase
MKSDNFGDRIKGYESCGELTLTSNLPIIVRLDGNSFSKLTKRLDFKKPFDEEFRKAMESAMVGVFDYSGAKLAYSQSDEITLLINNPLNVKFLSNRISKICSLLASVATNSFNKYLLDSSGVFVGGCFDCRVFVVPEKEVNNVFLWRQKDAWKNAVYSYAFFELQNKKGFSNRKATSYLKGISLNKQQDLILKELDFSINDLETKFKRGFCCERKSIKVPVSSLPKESQKHIKDKDFIERNKVVIDLEIPLFSEDKSYIEKYLI